MKLSFALTLVLGCLFRNAEGQNSDYQPHYLVGLLNHPQSYVPEVFKNHTSGTYMISGPYENWKADPRAPFSDVPAVGFSDMEPYYDSEGNKVLGEFFCLSDNGYGNSVNSGDYPLNIAHMRIQKPFAYGHGGSTFETYTETESLNTVLIHDPHELIKWENGADIQVMYKIPDETWNDYKEQRVLTGRDLDPEGLAVISQTCAVLGDELMSAILTINPSTGEILSPFVRTPDIDEDGNFNGVFLSTVSDKVHCDISVLETSPDDCRVVDPSVVEKSDFREHHKSGGYEGIAAMADGSVTAFLEFAVTGSDEPGPRVYKVDPGNCGIGDKPTFESFLGFYKFEIGATNIADVASVPGSSNLVIVIERNGYPGLGYPVGHKFPSPVMPANKVCVVDLTDKDENMVIRNKKCILNYHIISDPWDVDNNGINRYGQTQVTNEALIVVDDYCIVAGTDTNFPWTNQLDLDLTEIPFAQEVEDSRFMVVCFEEPIFSLDYDLMHHEEATPVTGVRSSASRVSNVLLSMITSFVVGVAIIFN